MSDPATGQMVDVGLHVLDRQILDRDGRHAGTVDDLELAPPESGEGPPIAVAILSGPGALSLRLGGHIGRLLAGLAVRLADPDHEPPARVPFGVVKEISDHVELSVAKADLPVGRFEAWVRERLIAKLPGSRHAAE